MTSKLLRILIVEDSPDDAELVELELVKAGYDVSALRVDTFGTMQQALTREGWDVIISDHSIPAFGSTQALKLLRETGKDIPFIIVSGSISDETAVAAMRAGAHDYVLKENITRLVPAVEREIQEAATRQQKRGMELELKESEARLRTLTEMMPQIVWTANADGTLDYFNERWHEYSGISTEQSVGNNWLQSVYLEDLSGLQTRWAEHIGTGEPFEAEFRLLHAGDSQYRWHLTRGLAVRDAAGRITKWYGTMTDIHDRKLAEQALERSNRALQQFAYAAAHDLQEPLRNVALASSLLSNKFNGEVHDEMEQLLATNVEEAKRMHNMVKDLLAFTKVVQDGDISAPLCNTENVLTQVLASLARAIQETGAEITHGPLPPLRIRDIHLMQLFQNLIGNSLKYRHSERPPKIHITAERQGSNWVLAVRDNGVGFDPAYGERIFGLFKRLHARDEYGGSGIGLALCLRIVEHYGGRIWASAQPEQGATFFFQVSADA